MRLSTLERFDDRTAKAILAAASLRQGKTLLPDVEHAEYGSAVEDLLAEASAQLGLSPDDKLYEQKLREFLSKQVVAEIMGDTEVETVISQMGQQGRLPISSYKLSFDTKARSWKHENQKYIRRMIPTASDVQHIVADGAQSISSTRGVTLIVIPQEEGTPEEHWIIINALRHENRLDVGDIFRVFPDKVDLSEAKGPLDMLRAFIDHYGLEFGLEHMPPARRFEQLELSSASGKFNVQPPVTTDEYAVQVTGATVGEGDDNDFTPEKSFVVIAYCINYTLYDRDRKLKALKLRG